MDEEKVDCQNLQAEAMLGRSLTIQANETSAIAHTFVPLF